MDADGLPLVGSGIDYTKVNAINQKRLLAFVNYFLSRTVQFLNRFSGVCEEKLADLSLRIERVETTMSILETKLASIPGLDDVKVTENVSTPAVAAAPNNSQQQAPSTQAPASGDVKVDAVAAAPQPVETPPAPAVSELKVKDDPALARYFKMLQVGVHPQAIKNKMTVEGFDPDLLDNPDAPSPNVNSMGGTQGGGASGSSAAEDSDSSSSGFSD